MTEEQKLVSERLIDADMAALKAVAHQAGLDGIDLKALAPVLDAAQRIAVAAERQRCIDIVESYAVSVGNSRAGELAAEWTMENLREVRDTIRQAPAGEKT